MTTAAKKPRVFLMSDYFIRWSDYYLVAEDKDDAIEKGRNTKPLYREESDEEYESTEVEEEIAILVLRSIAPQPGQQQQVYCFLLMRLKRRMFITVMKSRMGR